jgi:hydroxypyruvate reductase
VIPRGLAYIIDTAVVAASPWDELATALPAAPPGRTVVVGAGKAAAVMARAVEDAWSGPLEGIVVTRDGHGVPCERVQVVEAAHPLPDARGREAAARILELARGLGPDDLLIALFSGGGSAPCRCGPGLSIRTRRPSRRPCLLRRRSAR